MTNLLFENVEDLSLVAVRESEQSVSYFLLLNLTMMKR